MLSELWTKGLIAPCFWSENEPSISNWLACNVRGDTSAWKYSPICKYLMVGAGVMVRCEDVALASLALLAGVRVLEWSNVRALKFYHSHVASLRSTHFAPESSLLTSAEVLTVVLPTRAVSIPGSVTVGALSDEYATEAACEQF